MSRFEIYLSKNDLEHIANEHDIKIKIDGKRFLTTNEIIYVVQLIQEKLSATSTNLVCSGDDTSFKLRTERNRITGETKQ